MTEDNSNNFAARVAALVAKANKADQLEKTVEELRTALRVEIGRGDAHSRNTEWWRQRNSELHDEVSALKNEQRNLRGSLRSLVNEKSAFIHEVADLKREVAALTEQVKSTGLSPDSLPPEPFNDEWDAWSDEANDKEQVKALATLRKAEMLRTLRETLPPDSFVFIEPTFDDVDPADRS